MALMVAFVCIPNAVITAYPPTRQKRQLTFLSSNLNWNDASLYCSQEHGGSLLEHSSHATEEMVSRYSNGIWSGRWGNDYWLGLYIQDMSGPVYEWDGTCEVASTNSYNHFEGSPPSSGDLDSTKKCAVAKKDTLEWRFEKCSIEYVAICQTILGQCTYERDIPVGACVTVTVNSLKITAADRDACEAYCSSINADDQANGECWAVTFYTTTKYCAPSISRKPYDFDTSGSKYSSSCNDNSLVSWKRCFEDPGEINSYQSSGSGSDTPIPKCNAVPLTTTTTTTTTTEPPTTTTPTTTTTTQTTTTSTPTTTTTTPTTATTTPTTTTTTPTTTTTTPTTTTTTPTTTTTTPTTTTTTPTTSTIPTTTSTTSTTPSPTTTTTSPTITTSLTTTTTSPTTTTKPLTSTSPTSTTTSSTITSTVSCVCRCILIGNISLEEKIARLQEELTVDIKQTSSYIRKHISASDERPSAKGIGMVLGAGMLVSVFGVIVLGDVVKLFRFIGRFKSSLNEV